MGHPLYHLLLRLEADHVPFTISRHRSDSIMVTATFVGERVEVDIFDDGHMELSRFLGTEDVLGGAREVYDILEKKKAEESVWEEIGKRNLINPKDTEQCDRA